MMAPHRVEGYAECARRNGQLPGGQAISWTRPLAAARTGKTRRPVKTDLGLSNSVLEGPLLRTAVIQLVPAPMTGQRPTTVVPLLGVAARPFNDCCPDPRMAEHDPKPNFAASHIGHSNRRCAALPSTPIHLVNALSPCGEQRMQSLPRKPSRRRSPGAPDRRRAAHPGKLSCWPIRLSVSTRGSPAGHSRKA